jgi:uncharacterized protein (TIGR03083 family)
MSSGAVEALRADRDVLLEICGRLTDAEWKAPSGCEGWSVQDVVAHMGSLFWLVVDRSVLPDAGELPTERAQDVYVESRRDWSAERVAEDYRDVSAKALEALAGLEGQDFELPLGDLGTYPAGLLPNAFSFDHFTHIRADLFEPRGSLTGSVPAVDELRLAPAFDWVFAALPQQAGEQVASLPGAVDVVVEGPAARTVKIGAGAAVASIRGDGLSVIRWMTQRGSWEALGIDATGDAGSLETARRFHVF